MTTENQNKFVPKLVKAWGHIRLVQTRPNEYLLEAAYRDALGETRWSKYELNNAKAHQHFFHTIAQVIAGEAREPGETPP